MSQGLGLGRAIFPARVQPPEPRGPFLTEVQEAPPARLVAAAAGERECSGSTVAPSAESLAQGLPAPAPLLPQAAVPESRSWAEGARAEPTWTARPTSIP